MQGLNKKFYYVFVPTVTQILDHYDGVGEGR